MKTVRETKLDMASLRLVEKEKLFIGLVILDGSIKMHIEGNLADDV